MFLNPAISKPGGFSRGARRNLTLRLSEDDGASWPHSMMLNPGMSGYSSLAVTREGKILCAYENGTRDYCEKISIVQVDRAALVAAKAAPAGGVPRGP